MSLFDLTDRVAIVTGATKGMGQAIAERFVEQGARVVIASRTEADCLAMAARLNRGRDAQVAIGCAFDLADRASVERPVDMALSEWGRLDALVANAGVVTAGNFGSSQDADYDHTFATNVRNNAALARAAAFPMRMAGGGSITFVGSTTGLFACPPYLAYSLAKAAVMHLARVLAVDLGPAGIRVNAIAPGLIRTHSTAAFHDDPELVSRAIGGNPLGRMGEGDEIAGAAVFLASPAGGYVTGHTLVVDGGQILQGHEAARLLAEGAEVG